MKSHPNRKNKQGICAYCGAAGDVTSDHVIPQCLWGDHAPSDVPKVDACRQCNHICKSGNDAYLRDLLVNDRDALQHPVAQELQSKYVRSVLTNKSLLNCGIRERGKVVIKQRLSGGFVPSIVVEAAEKRTSQIMSLIVRGLHQYYLNEPLPKNALFWINRLRTKEQLEGIAKDIAAYTGEYHRGGRHQVGDGTVFSCGYVEMVREDHTTLWQLNFYGTVVFSVITNFVTRQEISAE